MLHSLISILITVIVFLMIFGVIIGIIYKIKSHRVQTFDTNQGQQSKYCTLLTALPQMIHFCCF